MIGKISCNICTHKSIGVLQDGDYQVGTKSKSQIISKIKRQESGIIYIYDS
jgi:hypothetical protein